MLPPPSSAAQPARPEDFDTEFSDYILAVNDLSARPTKPSPTSTRTAPAIPTPSLPPIPKPPAVSPEQTDSAAVYVNASTRFTDGGQFGLGCEMGIATQKLHARGPMGLSEMTTYKYIIEGSGQVR